MSSFERIRKKRGLAGRLSSNQVLVNVDALPKSSDPIQIALGGADGPQLIFDNGKWSTAGDNNLNDNDLIMTRTVTFESAGKSAPFNPDTEEELAKLKVKCSSLEEENQALRLREQRLVEMMALQRLDFQKHIQMLRQQQS
jgi:hypothetical protein